MTNTKLCPTCGTRLSETATRCQVCGSTFSPTATAKSAKSVQGSRMPEVTLSLPAALGFLALFITIGAVLVYFTLRNTGQVVDPTATPTVTVTPTITVTPTVTATVTPQATFTPLPDIDHTVTEGQTCSDIAVLYNVSVPSITTLNPLVSCDLLSVGTVLKIPQPTPTASPQPSSTASGAESTDDACEKVDYTVADGDSLQMIAANYNVSMESIKTYNGMINDTVYAGNTLVIPLCERKTDAQGNTPTPTPPPPYAAPNLLLPMNGASYDSSEQAITLQWSSVGNLRANEAYAVTVEDLTYAADTGDPRKVVEYVTDNKFIIPASMRPTDTKPHLFHWSVLPVRQTGATTDGNPIWEPGGAASEVRGLIWIGDGSPPVEQPTVEASPTP